MCQILEMLKIYNDGVCGVILGVDMYVNLQFGDRHEYKWHDSFSFRLCSYIENGDMVSRIVR